MRLFALAGLLASAGHVLAESIAFPPGVPRSVEEFRAKHPYIARRQAQRPTITILASEAGGGDASDLLLDGLRRANNGGTLRLPKGETYMIGKPLDLTFLNDVQIQLDGVIKFTDDTPFWQKAAFRHPFQNSIMFWKWAGKDIKIYGTGILDGSGQRWWDEFSGKEILDPTNTYLRPILFYAENATGLEIEGIHFKDSPCWTTFIVTSKDIAFRDVVCTAESTKPGVRPKNTDFFDSLNVEHVTVERAWVNIGDDCFSPKSNATDLHVDTMYCNGTHGQSMGSVGQYPGEMSFIRDVVIENVWLLNGQHGARLKTWAGPDVGYGFIDNVTFRNFWQANNEYAAFLDSCYFNIDEATCARYPSRMNITNILFQNFTGTTSGKYGRSTARLTCSTNPNAVCENIRFVDWNIKSPCGGSGVIICDGIRGGVGTPCVKSTSPEASSALKATCKAPMATLSSRPWRRWIS